MSDFGDITRLRALSDDLNKASDSALATLKDYEAHIAELNLKYEASIPLSHGYRLGWYRWSTGWGLGVVDGDGDPVKIKDAPRAIKIIAVERLAKLTTAIAVAGETLVSRKP